MGLLAVESYGRSLKTVQYALGAWRTHYDAGEFQKATRVLERGLEAQSDELLEEAARPLALNNLAYTYLELDEKLERAYELATEAVRLAPNTPSFLDTLAFLESVRGQCSETRRLMDRAVTLDSDYGMRRREAVDAWTSGRKPNLGEPMEPLPERPPGIRI
jgi:tetratricopeptide (TPR) repeat protein